MQEVEEIVHGTTYVPAPSSSTGSATSALRQTGRNYFDLHPAALALDGQLYNVLRMAIKGGKTILLECVQFPSYIQAICVLYRHSDISRNDRIAHAFEGMDSLVFNGDILKWQSDAVRKFRELFDSGASIMHYGLSRVMKSFNGKLKTIQYKIAQDLNSREIDEHTNVFDMIQEYAAAVASVGDSAHTGAGKIAAVNDERCGYCHNIGHTEAVCRKKQAAKAKGGKGGGKSSAATDNRDYSDYECHFCHQKGHISRNCPEKAKTAAAAAPSPASVAAVQPDEEPAQVSTATHAGLAALLEHLRGSPAKRIAAVVLHLHPALPVHHRLCSARWLQTALRLKIRGDLLCAL